MTWWEAMLLWTVVACFVMPALTVWREPKVDPIVLILVCVVSATLLTGVSALLIEIYRLAVLE